MKKLTIVLLASAALALVGCSDSDSDNTAALALLLIANNNATITVTNNESSAHTYSVFQAGNNCTGSTVATIGILTAGSSGSATVTPDASGYDIKVDTSCSAVATAKIAGTYNCASAGAFDVTCN
ncbi:MAG: hypothetical protein KDK37_05155 [Leptospiraceae bacterium]|nr:hypothetical protein [Leptospiraceae bacterium]MCB1303638.1 hypothetical protein [Leptospiraceae bacterium]